MTDQFCGAVLPPSVMVLFYLQIVDENFYRTQVSLVRSMGLIVSKSVSIPFADFTDVTLADEDTNSILADNANRAIQGNVAMQVTQVAPSGGQILNNCKWCFPVTKFGTNTSCTTCLLNLETFDRSTIGTEQRGV